MADHARDWSGGSIGARIGGLAGARAAMHVLSLAWFVVSARIMNERQFGLMASALAVVVLVGALGDIGLSRTVVLAIAGDPGQLWPVFRRALLIRLVAAAVLSAAGVMFVASFGTGVSIALFLAAAATAFSSGVSELAFSALRAVGRTAFETSFVVLERLVFLAAAVPLAVGGAEALAIMICYAGTNALTAVLGCHRVAALGRRQNLPGSTPSTIPPLLDRHGWLTALSGSLVSLGFRIGTLMLVVFATPEDVGTFSIAQRAPEAVALLGITAGGPVLALARRHLVSGDRARAATTTVTVVMALLTATAPLFAWFVVQPRTFLELFFGAGSKQGASTVLVLLACTGVFWVLRLAGETMLLADGRSGRFALGLSVGLAVGAAAAAALVPDHGATGAAVATLLSEVIIALLTLGPLWVLGRRCFLQHARTFVALGTGTGVVLFGIGGYAVTDLAVVGACSLGAAVAGWRMLGGLDTDAGETISSSGPAGWRSRQCSPAVPVGQHR